ncbi:unnamed protein product [Cylicocyclus nassatus]|uniref:Transmembrane protein n=1 Tax=Cylicocyclus nassatus TaxID=53992 RepID=A0AA36M833_CYLNA|nr:unnamed protein product [Cylicocyclus nassatus]
MDDYFGAPAPAPGGGAQQQPAQPANPAQPAPAPADPFQPKAPAEQRRFESTNDKHIDYLADAVPVQRQSAATSGTSGKSSSRSRATQRQASTCVQKLCITTCVMAAIVFCFTMIACLHVAGVVAFITPLTSACQKQ